MPIQLDPEEAIQAACIEWCRLFHPSLLVVHVANQRKCSMQYGALLKRLGVVAGFPDLIVFGPGGHLMLIEMKAEKGKLSESQRDMQDLMYAMGFDCGVCRSVKEFQTRIEHAVERWKV